MVIDLPIGEAGDDSISLCGRVWPVGRRTQSTNELLASATHSLSSVPKVGPRKRPFFSLLFLLYFCFVASFVYGNGPFPMRRYGRILKCSAQVSISTSQQRG